MFTFAILRAAFSLFWLGVAWFAQQVLIANIVGLFLVLVYLVWFNAYFLVSRICVEVFITSHPVLLLNFFLPVPRIIRDYFEFPFESCVASCFDFWYNNQPLCLVGCCV